MLVAIEHEVVADLSVRDLSLRLRVSETTIRRRIAEGSIRAYRIGDLWRIPAGELVRIQREGVPLPPNAA